MENSRTFAMSSSPILDVFVKPKLFVTVMNKKLIASAITLIMALTQSFVVYAQTAESTTPPATQQQETFVKSPVFVINRDVLCKDSTHGPLSVVFGATMDFEAFSCQCSQDLSQTSVEIPVDFPLLMAFACRQMGMKHDMLVKDLLLDEVRYAVGDTACSVWLNFRISKEGEESYTDLCFISVAYQDEQKLMPKEARLFFYESPDGDPHCCGTYSDTAALQSSKGENCELSVRSIDTTPWNNTPLIFRK